MNENKSSNVKIGARVLSEKALDKLLPTNNNIHSQIQKMREVAVENNNVKNKHEAMFCNLYNKNITKYRDREYDRHFNNTIALLGERGSGKTSAMLTIKHKIDTDDQYKGDIVMPIIVPEKMGDSSDVLGWTIGIFGNIIENLENEIYKYHEKKFIEDNRFFKNCRKLDKSELSEKYRELLYYYTYTNNDYRKILLDNYEGLNSYINKSKNILSSEQELSIKFEELVDEIIDVKRKINNNTIEPLIFIFFDDVDLSTEKCMDLLNIILRYLSNSNIVTFVSGNYTTFLEVVTINNLKREGLLNNQKNSGFYPNENNNGRTALESRQILTIDILKKILPPALRYYFPKIKDKDKMGFTYSTEEYDKKEGDDSNQNTLSKYKTLKELIVEKLMNTNIEEEIFMEYNRDDIDIYFSIFDDKPRGLMNVYYFLNTLDNHENRTNSKISIGEELKSFINVVIHSSDVLVKYENLIYRVIDIQENLDNSFINYQYIDINISQKENITQRDIEDLLKVFLLANFIENIIALKVKDRSIHGKDTLIKILNFNRKFNSFKIYPNLDDIKLILQIHSKMISSMTLNRFEDIENLNLQSDTMAIYFDILSSVSKKKNIYNLLKDTYKQDEVWTMNIVKIILENSSSSKMILNKNIEKIKKHVLKITEDHIDREKINSAIESMDLDLENITYSLVREFNKIILSIKDSRLIKNYRLNEIKIDDNIDEHNTIIAINNHNTISNITNVSNYISDKEISYKEFFKNLSKTYILDEITKDMLSNTDIISKLITEEEANYLRDFRFDYELTEKQYKNIMKILNSISLFKIRTSLEYRDFITTLRKNMKNLKIEYGNYRYNESYYNYSIISFSNEDYMDIDEIINIIKLDLVVSCLEDIIFKYKEEANKMSKMHKFKMLRKKLENNTNISWFKSFVKAIKKELEEDSLYV